MSLRVIVLATVLAAGSAATVFNPPEAGHAIDAIEAALAKIVNSPHLTAAQLKSAKAVSANVEKTVQELESPEGKLLPKEAKAAKVRAAIKALQGLQDQWQKAAAQPIAQKQAELTKQLAAKEAQLAQEQKELKVMKLKMKLDEKKLALEKLVEMKNAKQQAAARQESEKQAAAQQEMVANVLHMAKSLQAAQGKNASMTHAVAKVADGKAAVLKTILAHLEGRMHNVSSAIAKLDAAEKHREDQLSEATFQKAPVNGSSDAIGQGRSLLRMLMKKEHRKFEKTRATLKNELNEISASVKSIKKGDVAGLTKVMSQMQNEVKSLQAKSHKFLY